MMDELSSITLHLKDIRDFFTAPEYDPFDPQCLDVSGIEYVIEYMRKHGSHSLVKLILYLPEAAITPDLVNKTRQAISRYCHRKIAQNESEIEATRRVGRRSLPYGMLLAIILALFNIALVDFLNLSAGVATILSGIYVIISWVSIWWPIENLVFDWIPNLHENRRYRELMGMDLSILPEPASQS